MNRFLSFLTDKRVLAVIGFLALAAALLLFARTLEIALAWVGGLMLLCVACWLLTWAWRRHRATQGSRFITGMMEAEAERAVQAAPADKRPEVEALRNRMLAAIKTIKTSKLGETSGKTALYELPWYLVIGNPAAGKSSAIVNSGLHFPFSDVTGSVIHGLDGTRNCDWFFTSEGILLDTAGRYSVYEADRGEWLSFLHLLKRHRPKAPINGILIAVSVAELSQNKPEYAINLAKQLRSRVQELSAELGVFAPVYVMFTKIDLVAGFAEFFEDADAAERSRTWGATLPYDSEGKTDAVAAFDEHFAKLVDGSHELSVTRMSMSLDGNIGAGVLSFPLEFEGIRPSLRAFIATLFEENPFQYKPVFRGFYFSSAVREGAPVSTSDQRMSELFSLKPNPVSRPPVSIYQGAGFFLSDLFSKVIFADKNLVRQFTSKASTRIRLAGFTAAVLILAACLSLWTWSFLANEKLVANIQADLDQAISLQQDRNDIGSRLQALQVIQDRLQQLQDFRESKPAALGFGLYQGGRIERRLRYEYFNGIRLVLLAPVSEAIEGYLGDVVTQADKLTPQPGLMPVSASTPAARSGMTLYRDLSPANVEDAYNALKTYLMLANRERLEAGHLNDQLTRFWRTWLDENRGSMPREQMIKSAEQILGFLLTQTGRADFPVIDKKIALVDQVRENLRRVVRGMPARERVYGEIKARAATRFPPLTVARVLGEEDSRLVAGSYAISGAFTREAWTKYVEPAIKEAANKELQSTDWVLKTSTREDLTVQGSPEQIQKALIEMYKAEYISEWKKFLQGVSIAGFPDFAAAVGGLNRLGDPGTSPVKRLMETLYRETSWDNPMLSQAQLDGAGKGLLEWFKTTILRRSPSQVQVKINMAEGGLQAQSGPISREFAAIAALMMSRGEGREVLLDGYLSRLSALRTRFNQMRNTGDPGPAARQLMQQTFDGSGSELADGLRFVDESMLIGLSDSQRATIRPLLVRPLMESFSVIVRPAEAELNKIWTAQVYEPFTRTLAAKYPFQANAGIEASPAEIAQVFGPDGVISRFASGTLASLVVQRGQTFTPRTWADIGIALNPEFTANYPRYVAPPGGPADAGNGSANPETVFQIMPIPSPGLTEYAVEIDGQRMQYRNGSTAWHRFQWPGGGTPGARVLATGFDGQVSELVNIPGRFGLEKMIGAAKRKRMDNGDFELTWGEGQKQVSIVLRIISQQSAQGRQDATPAPAQTLKGLRLPQQVVSNPQLGNVASVEVR
ncbi:MAG: type VI secretion protein VasK [Candidatus Dactylopiibacterium carminicum]|uniref:Type VI secretion protein VasK n=1 Tax=Candidatus Dactylopiibacterium carminicum TaxID=857335 RepID=A0A272ENR8_9RHOO|nr:type VI secretion system membrane subunit TssM [Candidatus Dactylopiibacterium carminicum]KAF7598130.1 type VI secretion system membrane subunit TssM [Candidatus Dactylopiibacterium carminicum]PAS91764.1 MAG: type VI secretion protein VasK [Candidatus Dactylopiibacterium carminicum]PAS96721.1 MAG: type VI secretion protein VasK [Candidatus Dactylopiibacterium carminicum]